LAFQSSSKIRVHSRLKPLPLITDHFLNLSKPSPAQQFRHISGTFPSSNPKSKIQNQESKIPSSCHSTPSFPTIPLHPPTPPTRAGPVSSASDRSAVALANAERAVFFRPAAKKNLATPPSKLFSTHETCGKAGEQRLQFRHPNSQPIHLKPTKYLTSKSKPTPTETQSPDSNL
jgi:hypothetical protein